MKKGFLLTIIAFSCLLLSGCTIGNKTENVTCSKSTYISMLPTTLEENFIITNKKVSSYKLTNKLDLSSYAYNKDTFAKMVDTLKVEFSKAVEKGVQIDTYSEGNYVITIITIDPLTFDGVLNYNNTNLKSAFTSKVTSNTIKTEYEKDGYTCTVKQKS